MRRVFVLVLLLTTALAEGAPPSWWTDDVAGTRIQNGGPSDNYAPLNLGQLKWVAKQAKKHLDLELGPIGGAGPAIDTLVASFTPQASQSPEDQAEAREKNYAPANLGQLKAVAKPFYDRLIAAGFNTKQNLIDHGAAGWSFDYPWNPATAVSANYAPANLGQLKWAFAFDLGDRNSDGLPDWWAANYGLLNGGAGNSDGDAFSNLYEFRNQLNPIQDDANGDRDGDGVPNREDARPNDATLGRVSVVILDPIHNSVVP